MLNLMKRFIREDDGLEMLEWAIVGALIALVGATAWQTLGNSLSSAIGQTNLTVTALPGNGI